MEEPEEDISGWENHLIRPLAKLMKEKGISDLQITLKDGKAIYVLDPANDPSGVPVANHSPGPDSAWPDTPGFYWWRGAPSLRWEMMQVLAYGAEDDQSRYMVQKAESHQVMRSLHVWKERGPACGEWVKIPLPNQ